MLTRATAIVGTALLLVVGPAYAQIETIDEPLSAFDLQNACLSRKRADIFACDYFLIGLFQGYLIGVDQYRGERVNRPICPGGPVAGEELRRIYLAYATPQGLGFDDQTPAAEMVLRAFYAAWPCRGS